MGHRCSGSDGIVQIPVAVDNVFAVTVLGSYGMEMLSGKYPQRKHGEGRHGCDRPSKEHRHAITFAVCVEVVTRVKRMVLAPCQRLPNDRFPSVVRSWSMSSDSPVLTIKNRWAIAHLGAHHLVTTSSVVA